MRRFKKQANKFLPENYAEVKGMLDSGKTMKQVRVLTGWGNSTVNLVFNTSDYEEYRRQINDRLAQYKYRISHQRVKKIEQDNVISNGQDHSTDAELLKLEQIFESLKSQIAVVVAKSVEQGIKDYKSQTETELMSLRTVVDAAKSNNLVDMIKRNMKLA